MVQNVIKRNGNTVIFDKNKISEAILKANKDAQGRQKASVKLAKSIAKEIESMDKSTLKVEEIQDIIEKKLMESEKFDLAKKYILYREKRAMIRQSNTTDKTIMELIDGDNEYWNTENSNKNATIVTTQRDYIAGATSTDITRRFLLSQEISKAHDEGIIHFHDADYFAQHMHNCCLINLNDMLQNGTIVNGVMIEKPHKFITASTIATQIILGVSSSQYGGCTISLSHLAPFVRDSYNKYLEEAYDELKDYAAELWDATDGLAKNIAKSRLKKEIEAGVQTFNYQVNSMTNTNGQAPFLSVFMYLGETEEYKEELAMLIEEFLKQRMLGFKNSKGVYITPAFPKLLYVLEKDNITPDSKYWYLTELAAKCTAKRMVPDYISEKKMLEYKKNQWGDGDCYGCMGCRSFLTPWRTKGNPSKALDFVENKGKYYGRLTYAN